MKFNQNKFVITIIFILLFHFTFVTAATPSTTVQDDTVQAALVTTQPVFDGIGDDAAWKGVNWQTIDQVWIPYNGKVPEKDFAGRYKVTWSDKENVLYFLAETNDDVFVDGYIYNSNPTTGGGYPNYDILEVFIDENKSGGLHVFDGTGSTATQWGKNAENAFSYHIAVNGPKEATAITKYVVCDIAGSSWSQYTIPNFYKHFPSFAMRKTGTLYTWEFSLAIYNDTYLNTNPEASRVKLIAGKLMGLSLAYCDNDDPNENPKERDNFFGSVWVPEKAYNDHWMNADGFGTIKLMPGTSSVKQTQHLPQSDFHIFPNPATNETRISLNNHFLGEMKVTIYDLLGREIYTTTILKADTRFQMRLPLQNLPGGIYFCVARMQHLSLSQKIILY
ncbi:T9SS type A sorting domain-containing protein [candidate division KSB1 bacterium]|nr:T9SS type A sorting domain-containing protein [candidate division KSB1 bacterium]